MKSKFILSILLIPLLVGCQAFSASMAVISGTSACNSTEGDQLFPDEGSRKYIHISFDINDSNQAVSFSETATCEYQGSMCGGGAWFQVWYGDQTLPEVELSLENGNRLSFREHSQCIGIDKFAKACANGACKPEDYFGILVLYSDEYTELRKMKLINSELTDRENENFFFPERQFLPFSALHEADIHVRNLTVAVTNDSL